MTRTGRNPGLRSLALAGVLALALSGVASAVPQGEPGEVQWWDLLTEDAPGAAQFYSELLGWDVERGPKGNYVVRIGGKAIAGISQIEDTHTIETAWAPYVGVGVHHPYGYGPGWGGGWGPGYCPGRPIGPIRPPHRPVRPTPY